MPYSKSQDDLVRMIKSEATEEDFSYKKIQTEDVTWAVRQYLERVGLEDFIVEVYFSSRTESPIEAAQLDNGWVVAKFVNRAEVYYSLFRNVSEFQQAVELRVTENPWFQDADYTVCRNTLGISVPGSHY